jgi:hypothetical protein
MLYEIINPSDAYTLETDDFASACLAIIYLGEGMYGLTSEDRSKDMPPFVFAKEDQIMDWLKDNAGVTEKDIGEAFGARLAGMADVFGSVVIGSFSAREQFVAAVEAIDDPAKRETFVAKWNDKKRSSMNNIGARCKKLATAFRDKANEPAEAK